MRKWVHGYSQEVAIEYGLSNDELLILRHFEDFASSNKMDSFYENGMMFYWVNYDKFLSDLPIIHFKKERLGEIMLHDLSEKPADLDLKMNEYSDKMKAKVLKRKYIGVLKNYTLKNATLGTRSYFAFTDKFYKLKPSITENDEAMKQNSDSVKILDESVKIPNEESVKIPSQDSVKIPNGSGINTEPSTGKNTGTKIDYYKDRLLEIDINIYSRVINKLNKLANKNYKATTNKTKSLIDARLNEGFNEEDFYKVIEIKCKAWKGTAMDKFLRPETLFGPKFEGYLNESEIANQANNKPAKQEDKQKQKPKQVQTVYHGQFNEHFRNYSPEELERMLLRKQAKDKKKAANG